MANSQSVLTLVASVRRETDQVNSTTFSDTTELVPWVRDSLKQLYEILTQRWVDWYTITRPVSLVAGVERYCLPSDCRCVVAVYLSYADGRREIMRRWQRERYGKTSYGAITYRIMGNRLIVQPRPSAAYANALELHYVPQWTGPLLDWTTIDNILPNGWETWVKLDVMQKMRMKMNLDTGDTMASKREVESRIIAGARERDGEALMMRDVWAQTSSARLGSGTLGFKATWTA